ncbi:MAG: NUDIX domain-containing protein [Terriglobales bacterium]|jgi:8-oxo-dGTP pyrophosphatase MutT (NUDIX family)
MGTSTTDIARDLGTVEGGFYQVAAVCYRQSDAGLEFLLVNTRNGRWTFPKGNTIPGLRENRAAQQEAFEEAGAYGQIDDSYFALYLYNSGGEEYPIKAFLMEVDGTRVPGELFRTPMWCTPRQAKKRLSLSRSRKYSNEFCRIVDHAAEAISKRRTMRPPSTTSFSEQTPAVF